MKTMGLWAAAALIAACAARDDVPGGSPDRPGAAREAPWAELEGELRARGLDTDTGSLIRAAESHPEAGVRWTAVEVLGLRGERGARESLLRIFAGDPDSVVRESAALALARLGDEEGKAALRRLLAASSDPKRQVHLAARLAEFGDASGYEHIRGASRSTDPHLRFLAAGAMVPFIPIEAAEGYRKDEAVADLLALAADAESKVRYEFLVQVPFAVAKGAPVERIREEVERMSKEDADRSVKEKAGLVLILLGGSGRS
jgi:HEAT repeat protein